MRTPLDDIDIDKQRLAAVPVEHITVQLPSGATEEDYRAAYAAIAEQDGYWLLFPERLTHT